jgi:ankyrin repeat protein
LDADSIVFGRSPLNLNIRRSWGGTTPLHDACAGNHVECVRLLLEHGADMTIPDWEGSVPLHFCDRSLECTQLLVQAGCPINIKNTKGYTLLHVACGRGESDIVHFLVNNGADLNCRLNGGETPLFMACVANNYEAVRILIDAGADLSIKNNKEVSLLHDASKSPHAMKLLLEAGCPVNEKNINGDTPLHYSCIASNLDCVKMLIEYGADPYITNNTKTLPIDGLIALREASLDDDRSSTLDEIIVYLKSVMEVPVKEPDMLHKL